MLCGFVLASVSEGNVGFSYLSADMKTELRLGVQPCGNQALNRLHNIVQRSTHSIPQM